MKSACTKQNILDIGFKILVVKDQIGFGIAIPLLIYVSAYTVQHLPIDSDITDSDKYTKVNPVDNRCYKKISPLAIWPGKPWARLQKEGSNPESQTFGDMVQSHMFMMFIVSAAYLVMKILFDTLILLNFLTLKVTRL